MKGKVKIISGLFAVFAVLVIIFGSSTIINKTGVTNIQDNAEAPITYGSREEDYTITVEGTTLPFTINGYFLNNGRKEDGIYCRIDEDGSSVGDTSVKYEISVTMSETNGHFKETYISIPNGNYKIVPSAAEGVHIEEVKYEGNTEKIKLSESMTQGADLKIPVIFKQDIYNNGAYPGNFTRTNAVTFSGIFVQEDGTEIPFNKSIEYTIDWDVKIDNVTNYNIEAKTGDKFITNGNEYIAVLYVKSGSSKEEQGWGVKHRWLYKLSNFKIGNTLPKSIDVYTDSPSGDTPTVVSDSNYDKTNDVLTYKIDHIRADGGFPRDDAGAYLVVKYDKSALDAEGSQKSTTIHGITQIKAYVNPKINHTDRTPIINDDDNKETEIEQEKGYELNSMYSNPMEHSFELLCNSYDGEIIRYGVEVVDASKLNTAYYYNNFNVDAGFKELHRVDVIVPNILSQVCVKYDYTDENGELKEKSFSTAETAEHISMNDFTTYTGVFLSDNMWQVLGEDGYFKIIDDITGNVIETITSTDMPEYTKSKELSNGTISCHQGGYTYLFNEEDTYRRLRYETSQVKIVGTIAFNAFVKIHNDKMCKTAGNTAGKIDYETFQKLEKVWVYGNTHYKIGSNTEYETSTYKDYGSTDYVYGALNAGFGPDTEINGTTIVTKNFTYGIYPGSFERWSNTEVIAGYYNPVIIVEFPSGIKNVSIKNLKIKDGSKGTNKIDSIKKSNVTTVTGIDGEKHKRVYFYVTGKIKEAVEFTFDAVMTPDSQKIIDDEITSQPCKGYIVNTFDGKYESGHIVEDIGIVSWAGHEEDVNDINLNGDKTDNANYAYCNFNYTAPVGLATIVSVSDGNDVVQSPGIISVPKGVTQVDIINSYMNFSDNDVSDFRYIGRIPYEGNTSVHKGEDMNSAFNTTLTGPITIPDSFKNLGTVTVLYSTLDKNLESITSVDQFDAQNWEWRTEGNVSNWSNIKSFMIKLDGVVPKKTSYDFTYTINLPEEANQKYGQKTYAANAYISTSNSTTDGPAGSGKVGIMFDTSTRIDIALLKKDKDDNTILSGAEYDFYRKDGAQIYSEETKEYVDKLSYSISNNSSNPTKIKGLFPDTEYVLEEKTAPSNYKKQNILFKFDDQGNLEVIKGVEGFEGDMISVSKNNSSDTTYNVNIDIPEPKDEVNYTVQYYFQNDTGKYPTTPNAKLKSGPAVIGSTIARDKVQLDPTKVDGRPTGNYVLDDETKNTSEKTDNSLTIVADETKNIFKVYFSKTYTVTYKKGDHGTFSDDKHPGLVYGVKTPNCTKNTATEHDTGYVFTGWKPTVADTVTKDAEYVAQWAPDGDTAYKIEFYYQVNGNYKDTPDSTQNRTGTAFTNAVATDADKTPAAGKTGYVFDSGYAGNVLEKEIAANGSTVLKVYFKKAYTVTYKKGDHGTFSDDVHSGLSYGVKTPDCTKNTATEHDQGYVFNGWKPTVENTVTKDMIYIAQWIPDPNTKYSIQFYYQVDGNYKDTPDSTQDRTGTAFTKAVATDADKTPAAGKTGYVFDSGYAGNVLEKEIAANGSTILKVYFKLNEASYKVQYLYEDINGNYGQKTERPEDTGRKGQINSEVSVTADDLRPVIANYELSTTHDTTERKATVKADGTTILKVYFDLRKANYRVQYWYQDVNGQYSQKAERPQSDARQEKIGKTVTITDDDKNPKDSNYQLSSHNENERTGVVLSNNALVLKVYFDLKEADYRVQYWYQDVNGQYNQKAERPQSAARKDKIGKNVSVNEDDLKPLFENYELSTTHDTSERSGDVKADNSLILKVYFDLKEAKYNVEYYYQNPNKTYSKRADRPSAERKDKIGKTVNVTDADKDPIYEHYKLSTSNKGISSDTVKSDNSTVLKVYFDLEDAPYTVEYYYENLNGKYNQKNERKPRSARDLIGATVAVTNEDKNPLFDEYELSKTHDTTEQTGVVDANGTTVLKVYFDLKKVNYQVRYFYLNDNGVYPSAPVSTKNAGPVKVGTTITRNDVNLDPTRVENAPAGKYLLDDEDTISTERTDSNLTITPTERDNVFNVYFTKGYTVTYKPGTKGTFETKSKEDIPHGTLTPLLVDEKTHKPGYEFTGWLEEETTTPLLQDGTISKAKVTHDITYVAQWKALEVPYKVEFYYEENGSYPNKPYATVDNRMALTDTNVSLKTPTKVNDFTVTVSDSKVKDEDISRPKTDRNYKYDTEASNVVSANVEGDGSTVLKVYFKEIPVNYDLDVVLKNTADKTLTNNSFTITRQKASETENVIWDSKAVTDNTEIEERGTIIDTYTYRITEDEAPNLRYVNVLNGKFVQVTVAISDEGKASVKEWGVYDSNGKVADTDEVYSYVGAPVVSSANGVDKIFVKIINPVRYTVEVKKLDTADDPKAVPDTEFTIKSEVINSQNAAHSEEIVTESKDGLTMSESGEVNGLTNDRGCIRYEETWVDADEYTYEIVENRAAGNQMVNILEGYKVVVKVRVSADGLLEVVKQDGRNFAIVATAPGKVVTDDLYSYVNVSAENNSLNAIINTTGKLNIDIDNPVRFNLDIDKRDSAGNVIDNAKFTISRRDLDAPLFDNKSANGDVEVVEDPIKVGTYEYYIYENQASSEKYENILKSRYIKLILDVKGNGHVDIVEQDGKPFKVYDKLGAEITDQENVLDFIEVWPEVAETGDKAGITTIKVKITNPVKYFVNITTATTAYDANKNIDEYFLDKTDVIVNRNDTTIYSAQPTKDTELTEAPIRAGEYEYYISQTTTKSDKFVNPLENKFLKVTVTVSPDGKLAITKQEMFEGTIGDEHNKRLTNDEAEKYVKVSVSNPDNGESMLDILIIDPVRFSVEVKKVDTDNKPIENTQISINSAVVDEQNAVHKDEVIESAQSKDSIGITAEGIVAGTTNSEGVIKYEETWVESNESNKLSNENRDFYTYEITEIEPAGNQYVNVLEGYKVIVRVKVDPNGNVKLVDKNGTEYGKNAKYKYTIVKIADGSEVPTTDIAYKYVNVSVESNSVNAIIKGTDELKVNVTNPVRFDFDINKKSTDGLPLAGTKFTVTREGKDTPVFEGEPNEAVEIKEDPINSGIYTYLIRENQTNKTVGNRYVNVLEGRYIKLRVKVNANGVIDILDLNSNNSDYFEVYEESGKKVTDDNVLRYISVKSIDEDGDGVYKLDVNVTNPVRYEIDIITKDTLNQFLNGVNVSLYKVVGDENKDLYTDDATDVAVVKEVEKLEIPADAGTYTYYVKENHAPTERYINVLENKYIEIKLTVAPNGMLTETHKLYEGEIGKGKQVTTGEVLERYSVVADNSGDVSRLNVTIVNPVRFVVEVDKYDTANAPLTDTTFEIESPIIEDQAYEHNNEKINGIDDDGITTDGVVTGKTDNAIEKSKDGNMQRARISYEETWVDANDGNGYYTYYIRETKTAGAQYVNMLEGHKVVVRARVGADGTLTLVDKNGNAYAKDAEYKFTIETEAGQEITDTNNEMYKYVNISASNNKILATMNASIVNPVRYNIAVYETIYGDEKVKLNNIPVKVQSEFSGDTTLVTGSKENCNGYDYMEERAVWADTYEYRIFQLNEFNGVKVEDEFVNMLDGYYIGIDLYVPGNGDIKTISKDGDYTTVSYKLYKQTASGEYAEIDFNDTMVDDFVKVKITKDENNVCTLNIYIVTPEKYDFRLEKTDIDVLYSVNTYPEKYPEVSPNMNDVEFTVTVKDANGEIVLKDTKSGKDAKSEFATINTKSQLTKNVKGVDGILDFNNILIERCGTYTFEIEEVTPKVEGMIYKDKSEPIVLTADIVVENGKYVLKNMATKQAERYTIKEKTKLSGDQTQTVNVNVTNERIKGKYDLDLNKVNKFTGLPLDGAVYKVTVEQEGKEEKVLYLSNDDVLSMEQLIPYEEEESTSVNGTTSFKDIRIELPETYTIKIEEVKAPVIETEDGKKITFTKLDDVIELEVTTVIEGEFDDAHYVLGDIKLKEGNHDLISEKHSSKEEEKQNIGLRIENEYFDLALRQYVVDVNGTKFERKLDVNTDKLQSAEATDAEYKLNKNPQRAYAGQEVIYAIEVFNEGIIDGYAEEIMQYLPEGLEFVDDEFNKLYGWELNEDNTGVVTHALSKETNEEENLIAAYNKDAENEADRLSSKVIYLKLKVKEDVKLKSILTTVAEVTKYLANDRKESVDRDSYDLVTLPIGNDLAEYAENQEDDDDFEKLIIEEFDLAPVKFTKSVNGTEQKDKAPIEQLDETRADEYRKGIFNGFKYKNENEMLKLDQNDKIVYGIQVRNEGSVGSYATEVMDTIPSGLKFDKDSEINKKYGWKLLDADKNPTEDAEKAAYVVTDYLSEAKGKVDEETGKNSNWLAPLTIEGSDLIIDYKELEVEFIVTEPTSEDRIVKNIATIVKFIDDLGINVKDRDPEERRPDNVEKIYVNIFDLELEQVINSVEVTNTKTNEVTVMNGEEIRKLAKVDIAKSKLKNTNVKVEYKITIKNNGESAGYATEIKDYIPEGFIFDGNDNANWVANDGYVTTEALSNELLNPGDTREVTLVLRWNGSANVGVKENLSEISKHADKNKLDVVDWDSTPDNKVLEEDDIDYTSVILTVKTGSAEIAIMSIAIGFMVVTSLGITAYNRRRKA